MAGSHPLHPRARWVQVGGAIFLSLVTIAALAYAQASVVGLVEDPSRMGAAGLASLFGGVAGLAAALVLARLAGQSRLSDGQLLAVSLAFVAAVRLAVIVVMDAPLPVDGRAYEDLAAWLAGGGCCFADRPTGYPALLTVAAWIGGPATSTYELLNVGFAVAGGWFLWQLSRPAGGRLGATSGVALYAVAPALLFLTPVVLTDTLYATLILAVAWMAVRMTSGRIGWAAGCGLLLAASQYVRPIAPALLAAAALVPLVSALAWRRSLASVAVLAFAFGIGTAPVAWHNLQAHGDLSISTSSYGGWSLYIGTNQASDGRFNDADVAFMNALPGADLWERSEEAGRLAVQRIRDDPLGFAGLTVRKFGVMWGSEEEVVAFGFRPNGLPGDGLAGLDLLAQLAYLLVAAAAALAVVSVIARRRLPDAAVLAALLLLMAEAAVHTFVEVKPRYHAHAEALLIVLAAPTVAALIGRYRRR